MPSSKGVYAWLIFCAGGKKGYVQTVENRISGCLVPYNEQGETGGVCFPKRMRIISVLLSLRGDHLDGIGREFNILRFSSVSTFVERVRGKISGDRPLRNCVEEIKIVLQMSQA